MTDTKSQVASCISIELEIAIEAPRERVWEAIFSDTDLWWLPDFRVAGEGSKVTFDRQPGGRGMVEEAPDGSGLHWFDVQMILPADFKVYLVGHIAPDWGGPMTSNLKLELRENGNGCVLQVTDARHGHIDEAQVGSYEQGWQFLFTSGLKQFVESK